MTTAADDVPPRETLKALFARFDQIGFTRDERLELAEYLLRADVPSFSVLTGAQVGRLLDAIEGYALISHLYSLRGPSDRDAESGDYVLA